MGSHVVLRLVCPHAQPLGGPRLLHSQPDGVLHLEPWLGAAAGGVACPLRAHNVSVLQSIGGQVRLEPARVLCELSSVSASILFDPERDFLCSLSTLPKPINVDWRAWGPLSVEPFCGLNLHTCSLLLLLAGTTLYFCLGTVAPASLTRSSRTSRISSRSPTLATIKRSRKTLPRISE